MSLTNLQAALKAQADQNQGVVSLSAAVLEKVGLTPREGLDARLARALQVPQGLPATLTGPVPAPSGGVLAFTGKITVLGVTGTATLRVTQQDGTGPVDLSVWLGLGDGWEFSRSFPPARGYPFSELKLRDAWYVFTSAPQDRFTWETQDVGVAQGLNFVSSLELSGALGIVQHLVGELTGTDRVIFSGPVEPGDAGKGATLPVMTLTGPLTHKPVKPLPKYLPLSEPRIQLSTVKEPNGGLTSWVCLLTTLSVHDKPLGDLQAALRAGSTEFSFWFLPTAPITPELIVELLAGEDFASRIPKPLQEAFSAVGLRSLAVGVDTRPLGVTWISAGIGSTSPWRMGPFTVEDLVLRYTLNEPFGSKRSSFRFDAVMDFFPTVFPGKFQVEVQYSVASGALGVSAGYTGTPVSLTRLVSGLSQGQVDLSKLGFDISFQDFGVSFTRATATDAYDWRLWGAARAAFGLPVLGGKLDADFQATADHVAGNTGYKLVGGFSLGNSSFSAEADLGATKKLLSASWTARGKSALGVAAILDAVVPGTLSPDDIPEGLDLNLKFAKVTYDLLNPLLVVEADSANYGKAVLVARKAPTGALGPAWQYFFGIAAKPIDLSNLPLIGRALPAGASVMVDKLQVVYAPAKLDGSTPAEFNHQIDAGYPTVPGPEMARGVGLSMNLRAGSLSVPLSFATGGRPASNPVRSAASLAPSPPPQGGSSDVQWIELQQTFGPLTLSRVGATYRAGALRFLIDGSFSVGGLTISLIGASIGSPLKSFEPSFEVQGIGLAYASDVLTVGGSFMAVQPPPKGMKFQYDGDAVLRLGDFSLSAIGSYGQSADGSPTLFVFATLESPFGGPPAFFVTGLSAGFGFNRTVVIPTQDEVIDFPLLAWSAAPSQTQPPLPDILPILEGRRPGPTGKTKAWIAPSTGEYWLAAGIEFTSFELIHSQAVLIAKMGRQFELALLGLARMRLPQEGSATYAYGELELSAVWKPADGFLGLAAVLSPASFVIDPACHLTGGFAFYCWYAPPPEEKEKAGQFALTLGGYHPLFKPPPFYPVEPRLGFNWAVSTTVTIKGGAYFALTPSCVMAGGGLDIQFHDGGLRAWLTAYADFLVSWKPFHYDVSMGITIGVSFLTLKVELGVTVHLWGPPMGGEIRVHLLFFSFSIAFGQPQSSAPGPLAAKDFRSLLPAGDALCRIQARSGLAKTLDGSDGTWVVRADAFSFNTESAIPARTLAYGSSATPINATPFDVNIRPMNKVGVASRHQLTIHRGGSLLPAEEVSRWEFVSVERAMPESLWGVPLQDKDKHFVQNPEVPSARTVAGAPVGILVHAPRPTLGRTAGAIARKQLAYEPTARAAVMPLVPDVKPVSRFAPRADDKTVGQIRSIATKKSQRDSLFTALHDAGLYHGPNGDLSTLGAQAETLYADAPMQVSSSARDT